MNESGSTRVRISELLTLAHLKLDLLSRSRDEVLAELVEAVPELRDRADDRQTLLRALQERELLHSTGIGDEVALPHARNALVGLVSKPLVLFGRHREGIPYGAIDGQPARLFFLIVAPTVTQHLAALARISRLVRDPRVRKDLLSADKPEKILAVIREAESRM